MNRSLKWGLCLALGLGLTGSVVFPADVAYAQGKGRAVDTPMVKNGATIELGLAGLRFGMSFEQLGQLYDRMIDDSFVKRYKDSSPGPETIRLDNAVADAKGAFRRTKVEFGQLPTGYDSTSLKGEYTYQNQEALMHMQTRGGPTRYFFFIRGRMWKVYEEVPLGPNKPGGPSYEEALKSYAERFGVAGRVTPPDYAVNRSFTEVDWQDSKTRLRVVDRSGTGILGLIYEDRNTLSSLPSLRTAKEVNHDQVDPDVAALVRPPSSQPGPAEDADKGKGKGKGKAKGKAQ